MLLNCGIEEDSPEFLGLQDQTSPSQRKSVLNIHWKDWCWSCSSNAKNWHIAKDPDAGSDWRQEEKGMTEDEMVGWHHQLDRHESEQTPGVGEGQGCLTCCSPWGRKELDTTEWLNWTELNSSPILYPWSLTRVIPWVLLLGLSKYLLALYSLPGVLSLV